VGRVVAPHGIRGEVRVSVETDDPSRFALLERVYLGEERACFGVEGARLHKGRVLLKLRGIESRNAAEAWRNAWVFIQIRDALPLEEGQYYHHQVIGMDVTTDDDVPIGQITEIITTGANDVYVVHGPKGELLLPAIQDVILQVLPEERRMVVRVPEGLE